MAKKIASVTLALIRTEMKLYDTTYQMPAGTEEASITRLDSLYMCLKKIREARDQITAIPAAAYNSFPLTFIITFSHLFISLFCLSIMEYPGWDRTAVRNTVDILSFAEHVARQYEQCIVDIGIRNSGTDQDVARKMASMMRSLKAAWASKLPGLNSSNAIPMGFDSNLSVSQFGWGDSLFLDSMLSLPENNAVWSAEAAAFWGLPTDQNSNNTDPV